MSVRPAAAAPADGRLRIGMIAPVARPVTPGATGSIEQIVSLLTDGLVARGHHVTLFATGSSETSAELRWIYERGYDQDDGLWDWKYHDLMQTAWALEQADEFDVVHAHTYQFGLPFTRLVRTPLIQTMHVLPDPDVITVLGRYPDADVVAISDWQARAIGRGHSALSIHHGIDVASFPFRSTPGDYLLFLGRLSEGKGPAHAVEIAKSVGMPLVVAGAGGGSYQRDVVAPLLEGPGVEYVGWAHPEHRNELLANASALLFPVNDAEPFGLVMIEAMACGTPVLALDKGAVPEIVEQGVTGFYASNRAELEGRVSDALLLDRARIRERTMALFDAAVMVDRYEALYRARTEPRQLASVAT